VIATGLAREAGTDLLLVVAILGIAGAFVLALLALAAFARGRVPQVVRARRAHPPRPRKGTRSR
jgi:hypothetical protein